jgi:hypothetical protein
MRLRDNPFPEICAFSVAEVLDISWLASGS